jgi:hypothetical protein
MKDFIDELLIIITALLGFSLILAYILFPVFIFFAVIKYLFF